MTVPAYDPTQPSFTEALDRLRPQLEAIPDDQLEPVRHDITAAMITVFGVASAAQRFREQVRVEISEAAALNIDHLDDATLACGQAHAEHLTEMHGTDAAPLVAELTQQRRVLLAEAQSLVSQKRISPSVLAELVGGTGQKALCMDVLQLVAVFRAAWASIASLTAVTTAELDHVQALARALATTIGTNEQATSPASPSADLRQRAYTYFVRTYDEVRRAITFVRWDEDDADKIVPSLSAGRTRHATTQAAPEAAPAVAPVATPPAAPAVPGAPSSQPFTASS